MKNNILKDLATLTTIPYSYLKTLSSKSEACICHDVLSNIKENNNIIQFDIGIGDLVLFIDDNITYKFIPSESLEQNLVDTINYMESPLALKLEEALKDKVMSVYKELF